MIHKNIRVTEIAKEAGVSVSTVSRVLNHPESVKPETAARVTSVFRDWGISPAVKEPAAKTGGLILLSLPSIDNPFYGDVVKGAKASASAHGYHLLILQENINANTFPRIRDLIQTQDVVGFISASRRVERAILQELDGIVPVVQCCEYNDEYDAPYVSIDDCSAAKAATDYLISTGRKKIAFINGPLTYKYAAQRLEGFKASLEEHELTIPSSWVIHLPQVGFDIAYSSICQLLNNEVRPNALFAASDVFAIAAIRAAQRYGIGVPRDLSIVGFDNLDLSAMSVPSLTTVNQPRYQMGYTSCELLVERIKSPNISLKSILLDVEMIVRESTASIAP